MDISTAINDLETMYMELDNIRDNLHEIDFIQADQIDYLLYRKRIRQLIELLMEM